MRRIHPRHLVKVRALATSHVRSTQYPGGGIDNLTSLPSRRHQSSLAQDAKTAISSWTQHTLSNFEVFPTEPIELSRSDAEPQLAYIAFGSNMGNRIDWIEQACNEMTNAGIKILRTSSLWETDPMYVLDQDKFVNGVCEVQTVFGPLELLDTLQGIERFLGRERLFDKGPRNIDLDILLYGDEVVDDVRLKIPHALMLEREFVLRPLAELVPAKALNTASPWKTTVDYLNALPPSPSEMGTLTPLGDSHEPIRALDPKRKTQIMAIMNFTPDSFSNEGVDSHNKELMLPNLNKTAKLAATRGATIIDVGGQSSAPNTAEVTAEVEISRVVPPIQLLKESPDFDGLISIDTYRAVVAEAAVNAGADIINDISAGEMDFNMLPLMARLGKTVVLMHMRGTPTTMQQQRHINYEPDGLIPNIASELLERVQEAETAGIRRWRIILDPGIGFAKTSSHALEILRRLDELRDWPGLRGLPWLVGSSRKKFIGVLTDVRDPKERVWGTAATVAAAIQGGADIVRVHDVGQMTKVAKVSDAIWRV
ncbi:Folic acid synthesis protein [Lachnellula subtilissima]|uniref:Folic acid synthesis protein FOL1 n=1 Tax=Lachnellula subtilissima TaxID=602034 RepID=A0A8H8RMK6_9HELO|nr:Folic acid synthesis protein [Lachnellula subtilissima]